MNHNTLPTRLIAPTTSMLHVYTPLKIFEDQNFHDFLIPFLKPLLMKVSWKHGRQKTRPLLGQTHLKDKMCHLHWTDLQAEAMARISGHHQELEKNLPMLSKD